MVLLFLVLTVLIGMIWYRYHNRLNDIGFYCGEAKTPAELLSAVRELGEEYGEVSRRGMPLACAGLKGELYKERKKINYPLFKNALNKPLRATRLPSAGGLPRIYLLAREIIKGTRASFTESELFELLAAFQERAPLFYSEIAALGDMLGFVLCEFALSALKFADKGAESYIEIENAALALKMLSGMDFLSAASFYTALQGEECGVFAAMREESKKEYLMELARISERYNISEADIAAALVRLANENNTHIGEYLLEKRQETLFALTGKRYKRARETARQRGYILSVLLLGSALSLAVMASFAGTLDAKLIVGQLTFFLGFNAAKVLINALLAAFAPKRAVPLLEVRELDREDAAAVMAVKTVRSKDDIKEGFDSLSILKEKMPQTNAACGIMFLLPRGVHAETELTDCIQELYQGSEADFCFLSRRFDLGGAAEPRRGAALVEDACGYFLQQDAQNFLYCKSRLSFEPKYLAILDEGDILEKGAVQALIGAAKHPQNKGCNLFALSEKTNRDLAERTLYARLFGDSLKVYSDTEAANTVYGNVFHAAVLASPRSGGAGLVRIKEFYEICRNTLPEGIYTNFTLASALSGTERVRHSSVLRKTPASFGEYCRVCQNYVFGSFQHFPYIYTRPRGRDGKKRRLPPLYGFIVFDGINQSLINISSFLLLLISVFTGESLPALIVFGGYLLVPALNIFYQFSSLLRGNSLGSFFTGILKAFTRSLFGFSVLPVTFTLGLTALLRALINIPMRRSRGPALLQGGEQYGEAVLLLPNLIAAACFLLLGGNVAAVCTVFWSAVIFLHRPMGFLLDFGGDTAQTDAYARLKKRAKGTEFALLDSLGDSEENLLRQMDKIKKRISAEKKPLLFAPAEVITKIGETAKYHLMRSGGYFVVLDEAGAGISVFNKKAINNFGALSSECGTFITVDGARPFLPARTIFSSGRADMEYCGQEQDTVVKTVLLQGGTGELRQITIKNKSSVDRAFQVEIRTKYSLSELGHLSNQTTARKIPEPEIENNCARFITEGICTAEFLQGTTGEIFWQNGELKHLAAMKIKAGESAQICFVRLAAEDTGALTEAVRRSGTYDFCSGALRGAAIREAFSGREAGDAELRRVLLGRLMYSGLMLPRKISSCAFQGALNALNDAYSARCGFSLLVNLPEQQSKKAFDILVELFDAGFKFTAVFLAPESLCAHAPVGFFCLSDLSAEEKEILFSRTDFVLDENSIREDGAASEVAEYNMENTQVKSMKNSSSPHAEKNVLAGASLATVMETDRISTLTAEGVFTVNEILYIADRRARSFYTVTTRPIQAADTNYSVTHAGESRYEAENKTEKTVLTVSMSECGKKIFEVASLDKSGQPREMSVVLYFDIDGIRRYNLEKTEAGIQIYSPAEKILLTFPKESEYTFSHSEFFGRLNGRENPRGVLGGLRCAEDKTGCLAVRVNFSLKGGQEKRFCFTLSTEGKEIVSEDRMRELVKIFSGNALVDAAGGREALAVLCREQKLFSLGYKESGTNISLNNLALLYSNAAAVKNNILSLCRAQLMRGDFKGGAVLTLEGEAVRHYENSLSLPLVTAEYVDMTGDSGILETVVRYCRPRGARENSPDSETGEQVYYHCLRALRFHKIGGDGLIIKRGGSDAAESVLYFAAAKKFLKHVTSRTLRMLLVENMEKIRETLTALYYNAAEDEVKMCAYLAGVFNYFDRPVMKARMEEYIDLWITEQSAKKEFSPQLFRLIVSRVLGISFSADKLALHPALMKNLPAARAVVTLRDCEYDITVRRTGEKRVIIDGISYTNLEYIPLKAGEKKEIIAEI